MTLVLLHSIKVKHVPLKHPQAASLSKGTTKYLTFMLQSLQRLQKVTNAPDIHKAVTYGVPTFVKWAGGKTQLLEQLHPLMPLHFERYMEPFVGSGAVFLFVKQNLNPREILLSDNVEELVNCYKVVADRVNELITLLAGHKANHNKDYYYNVRGLTPSGLSEVERAARFLYLNKTCFNGLYRVNSKGAFNVPIGSYKNPNIVNEEVLRKASQLLQNVRIELQDFADAASEAQEGDFIYFDPPYYPLSSTANFTGYTANTFLAEEQKRLCEVFLELNRRGCLLMQSNSDTEFIRELYKDFRIETVQARRMINSDASKRGAISELVIMNY